MAGVNEAERMIAEGRDRGTVLARGVLRNLQTHYAILWLPNCTVQTVFDYGSDVRFGAFIPGDEVRLIQHDEYSFTWECVSGEMAA